MTGSGSIPAAAGDGVPLDLFGGRCRVYPRWCGGRSPRTPSWGSRTGLSPLVRGTGLAGCSEGRRAGSIPAGAGDGWSCARSSPRCRVYPRWCGGRWFGGRVLRSVMGLSPLVRGTESPVQPAGSLDGSIPAGAGDGERPPAQKGSGGVYPRWCGGRVRGSRALAKFSGLSPLVRGTVLDPRMTHAARGSIPAGAGDGRLRAELLR